MHTVVFRLKPDPETSGAARRPLPESSPRQTTTGTVVRNYCPKGHCPNGREPVRAIHLVYQGGDFLP